jgi:hypothetical protein
MILDLFKKKEEGLDEASREALTQAEAQRARMDLIFEGSVTSLTGISGAINIIRKDSLVLDVYGLTQGGALLGKYFTCYFRIREGRTGVGFYSFRTKVLDTRATANGGLVFVTSMPAKVDRAQRRRSMRVRPQLGWFEELEVWPGADRMEPEAADRLIGLGDVSPGGLCRLENMSAGGLGLHLSRDFCRKAEFCPTLKDEFTIHLRFAQEVRNQPRELWLSGMAVRVLEDRVSKDKDVGLEFNRIRRVSHDTGEMQWLPVSDNVADELMTRVFEWHATLARERVGLTE